MAFWFAESSGYRPTAGEPLVLDGLYGRVITGLAFVLTGKKIGGSEAALLLERTAGGAIWRGVARIWNACAAAVLDDRLEPGLRSDLSAQWIAVKQAPMLTPLPDDFERY